MRNGRTLVVCVCGAAFLAATFGIYYYYVGFVHKETLQFTYTLPCGQVEVVESTDDHLLKQERINRRQKALRALSDCFIDWKYESKSRSRPFYIKVAERVAQRCGAVGEGAQVEKINCILKDAQFEVVQAPDDALPVMARIILKARDELLLKETVAVFKECLKEYIEGENKKREERAVSPLKGKYITLQAKLNHINKRIADQNLPGSEKNVLREQKAELENALLKLDGQIKEAENIACGYGCEILFLP